MKMTISALQLIKQCNYDFQGNHTLTEQSCSPAVGSSPDPDNEDDEQEALQDNPVLPEAPVLPATPATVMADDDKQIRVSVYWYTRSLKKNKGEVMEKSLTPWGRALQKLRVTQSRNSPPFMEPEGSLPWSLS
jgi:hypothetical protein